MSPISSAAAVAAVLSLGLPVRQPSPSAGWLAGCWALRNGDRLVEESWMPERGGVMLGMSRTSVSGELKEYEFVMLRTVGPTLEYHVLAGRQPEVVFRSTTVTSKEVVFENPTHDFPKRIGYRLVSPDSLEAWIDGGAGDKGEKIAYPYRRAECTTGR